MGDTWPAASSSQAHVEAAIALASNGDIVTVPSGTSTWTALELTKAISIIGNGYGNTVITDGGDAAGAIGITGVNGLPTRVSSIGFNTVGSNTWGAVQVHGTFNGGATIRVDNCRLYGLTNRGISIWSIWGLIDHCLFQLAGDNTAQAISIFGDTDSGDDAWTLPLTLGTANAVYIEDNEWDYDYVGDGVMDAYGGARYVFRYNTVTNSTIGHHGADSGGYHSTHSWEIYENTFARTASGNTRGFFSRGGTGVIFNNTYTGNYDNGLILDNYRSCGSYAPWGQCNGSNPIDGNEDGSGYPCFEQNGRTTSLAAAPIYAWGNTWDSSPYELSADGDCSAVYEDHILEDRDFFNSEHPTYVAYTYPHPLQGGATEYTGTVADGVVFGDARLETGLPYRVSVADGVTYGDVRAGQTPDDIPVGRMVMFFP